MKTLYLLRHAKAAEGELRGSDVLRPLAKRGIKASADMAAYLRESGVKVDQVFCSTAMRTRETYDLVAPGLNGAPVAYRERLYLIGMSDLLDFIQTLPDTSDSVMLIGHNPAFHTTAVALTKAAERGQANAFLSLKEKFPTCALCAIAFDIEHWAHVKRDSGVLGTFVVPRDLDGE